MNTNIDDFCKKNLSQEREKVNKAISDFVGFCEQYFPQVNDKILKKTMKSIPYYWKSNEGSASLPLFKAMGVICPKTGNKRVRPANGKKTSIIKKAMELKAVVVRAQKNGDLSSDDMRLILSLFSDLTPRKN